MRSFWGPTKTRSEAAAGPGVAGRWGHHESSRCLENVRENSISDLKGMSFWDPAKPISEAAAEPRLPGAN